MLPDLNGKLDGSSIRVPTPNVSVIDFKFIAKRATTKDEINEAIKRAAEQQLKGVLGYTDAAQRLVGLQPRSAFLGLPPRPDQGHGRHLRARHVLVRQRVGLLEPHGRHRRCHGEAYPEEARMTAFRTLDQADVKGKRVLVRVDLNVPMENGRVTDATRIERVAADDPETRREGREGRSFSPISAGRRAAIRRIRLKPVAEALATHLGKAGGLRRRLHRRGAQKAVSGAEGRRRAASGEHPLPCRRGEERPGLRRRARQARRPLRQRRLLGRAPRARLDRRPCPHAARLSPAAPCRRSSTR